ncbi:endonuclease/exonuclease/phosphatase family protein [Novosphingobium resinovorum]|uniref:endonuclease/exonuclease/phosphatase family protein n=1 Tax=Novosphingobium resinovorum TaxID=158500 RepID=UPI002ED19F57|nr:endonuclease/exonuclease/phosphatase family protein [Novosphingobium resinovorum]
MNPRHVLAALSLLPIFLLAACGTAPPLRHMPAAQALAPTVERAPDGVTRSTTLSVLTYNVEGLGWPARSGRADDLNRIGAHLAALRATCKAPDVVMFQEVFSGAAKKAILATGYPAIVHGPRRTTRHATLFTDKLPGRAKIGRGELGMKLTGSGLVIASSYPVLFTRDEAYGRRSCAGIDCLANKGIMLARISIPGVPAPIDLFDTHMNSRGASKAPLPRNLEAHARQAVEASAFIDRNHDDSYPIVFGGDFNMRHSAGRWENFTRYQPMELVHRACMAPQSGCDVRMSWDGDEPWVDTQDLQFFEGGDKVAITPIRVEALFDGGPAGPVLSDHDGFLVTYRLTWREG